MYSKYKSPKDQRTKGGQRCLVCVPKQFSHSQLHPIKAKVPFFKLSVPAVRSSCLVKSQLFGRHWWDFSGQENRRPCQYQCHANWKILQAVVVYIRGVVVTIIRHHCRGDMGRFIPGMHTQLSTHCEIRFM